MKKLMLVAAMLLTLSFSAYAQPTVILNNTNCAVTVMQQCLDAACGTISVTIHPIGPNMNYTIPTPCPAGSITTYMVCWDEPGCMGTCVTVEGSPFPGCAGGAYNAFLPPCFPCSPGGAIVDYDLAANVLNIF